MTGPLPPPPRPPTDLAWLIEPARPDRVRRWPHAPWLVVATVCLGAFMGQLDASIVTLALPPIQRHFHAGLGGVEWVSLAYLVALVVLVVPVGRLADMLGRKMLYVYGFVVFTIGSIACGLAPALGLLVAFRVLQAGGAALLQANSVALIVTAIPRERLGRAIGVQGAAQAVGLAVGPAVGGALVAAGGWRWVFLVNVPVGVVGVVSGLVLLPRTRRFSPRAAFDRWGLVAFAVTVGVSLLVLSTLREHHHGAAGLAAAVIVVAIAATVFAVRERRSAWPLLPLSLLARRPFTAGLSSGLLGYAVMFGVLFATPFLLTRRGEPPGTAGLVLTALPAGLALVAPLAGRLADRTGPTLPTTSGMGLAATGLLGIALLTPSTPGLAGLLAVVGAGLGLFTPANNAAVVASAPPEQSGVAGGVLNMTRGIGTSLGVALTGLFLATRGGGTGEAGYRHAVWLLAGCAVAAAAVCVVRRPEPGAAVSVM